ncbi:MAG: AraC family transcriptional regulator [Planctomycetota bacterium]|nr:MAG: AraC family transcriptional regulator [Planctomycetota bacterium]
MPSPQSTPHNPAGGAAKNIAGATGACFSVAPWQIVCRRIYRGPVPASGQRRNYRDDLLTIWGIRQGHLHLRSKGDRHLHRGSWVALPPGCARDQHFSAEAELDSLALELQRDDGLPAVIGDEPQMLSAESMQPLFEDLLSAAQVWQAVASMAQIMAVVQTLPAWRWDGFRGVDPRLARVLAKLSADPCCGSLEWSGLEQLAGCSRRQLDRLALSATGMSVTEWNTARARERACALLRNGSWSIKEVARAVHAANASAFSHWFQRQTGHGPRAWQRMLREGSA